MAILGHSSIPSRVQGAGEARAANVSLSAGIMEMLSTTYSYIMMAAFREGIQNGCDAVKRVGLSFAEGVFVTLPTIDNPLMTIVDKGPGMTKEFMEADDGYMSFGVSTKGGSNDEAGGLGVGRWAAYGYIRECIIKTTHASDMVERTYFQFQGDNRMPLVAPAVERPGMTQTGTMVSFPIHPEDIQEAYRAVAWLKAIMQLTMGDSFTVDAPALLEAATATTPGQPAKCLPEFSGIVLDLEAFDPALKGVRVYPMRGISLQYSTKNLTPGSLVVLTNQERGVGGLPFHVTATGESAFAGGMIVEIPMSFAVEFMPSREALKYTPKLNALMESIDAATKRAAIAKVDELYTTPGLKSKKTLTKFVRKDNGHFISLAMHSTDTPFGADLKAACGRISWNDRVMLKGFNNELGTTIKVRCAQGEPLSNAHVIHGQVYLPESGDKPASALGFQVLTPPTLIVNDLPSGGIARFREYAKGQQGMLVLIGGDKAETAHEQAKLVNTYFGDELTVLKTSDFPAAVKRVIRGSSVGRATKTNMLLYRCERDGSGKQITEPMSYLSPDASGAAKPRVWIGKEGRKVLGLGEEVSFSDLINQGLHQILKAVKVNQIFLLTGKEIKELQDLIASVKDAGAWDASVEEFSDLDIDMTFAEVQTLKQWTSFEEVIGNVTSTGTVFDVLQGNHLHTVIDSTGLNSLMANLAKAPRMALTGTRVDAKLAPYFDLLTGERKLPRAKVESDLVHLCASIAKYGSYMEVSETDPDARSELKETLKSLSQKGKLETVSIWLGLAADFPMLGFLGTEQPAAAVNDLVQAMGLIYR